MKILKLLHRWSVVIVLCLALVTAHAGLIHRYSFTSNANDSVGNANGALLGGAVVTNGAVVLNGAGAYVSLPSGLISSLSNVTFEAWVLPATNGRVFFFGNSSTFAALTTASEPNFAVLLDEGAEVEGLNGPVFAPNEPYYLAVTYSPVSNVSTFYVNGALVASNAAPYPLSAISDADDWLGKSVFASDPDFAGSIDEFRIWDSALTAGQIATNYANGPGTPVGGPTTMAAVANSTASVLDGSATLAGQALWTGGQTPVVTLYYGTNDGGTNAAAWGNQVVLGATTGTFSAPVSGLMPNITYFFTASASNSAGVAWAAPSGRFTTLAFINGLIHRYSFTSNANDSVGNANGALLGGALVTNGAVVLNGAGAYVSLPSGLISSLSNVTFEAWVLPATNGRVFFFGNFSTFAALTTASEPNFAVLLDDGAEVEGLNGPVFAPNEPYYLAVTYSPVSNVSTFYVNGALVASNAAPYPLSAISDADDWLGKSVFASDPDFAGSIDEFRIWDSALTAGQIATNYANGPGTPVGGPTTMAAVANSPASVLDGSATLAGQALWTGGQTPVVTLYYGTNDGGTNAAAWGNQVVLGATTGTFSAPVSGLMPNITYFFTASASNSAGVAWAAPSGRFTTLAFINGLIHRYSFTSNANDSVGNANGALLGGAVVTNGAVVLNGAGAYVSLPSGLISSLSNVTFEAWVLPATNGRVFFFGNFSTFAALTTASEPNFAVLLDDGAEVEGLNGPVFAPNEPYYLAVTYSPVSNVSTFYVNGALVASNAAPYPLSAISDADDWLGKSVFASDPDFAGSIDEFRIWDSALTAGQIATNYANGPGTPVGGPTTMAAVANSPASVLDGSATLAGQALWTGGQTPVVTLYYGTNDGGTNAAAWGNQVVLGATTGTFSAPVSGLMPNITYFFTASASNSAGVAWAAPSGRFTTLAFINGLIHRYSFTSNANDSVGNANGALLGGAVVTNGAVVLNGAGAYVSLPSGLISSLSNVTFEAWVLPATNGRVFFFGNFSTFAALTTASEPNFAVLLDDGAEVEGLNGPVFAPNEPYYLAVTYSPVSNVSTFYVNGALVASNAAPYPLSAISDADDWLGKSVFASDPDFAGSIDEFRIWDSALTAGQIATNYNNGPNNLGGPTTMAAVANSPAGVLGGSATLAGRVLWTGGQTPVVTIYYGTNDGGTNAAAWANQVVLVAVPPGTFSTPVFGLMPNTPYFFTASASNAAGVAWAAPSGRFTTGGPILASNLMSVLTYNYNNSRTGQNTNESLLTPANVNPNSFGLLFSYPVDGYVYAQPLLLTNVAIPGGGLHNVVFVASEHDSVYAFDADNNAGSNATPLWQASFLFPKSRVTAIPWNLFDAAFVIGPETGITATPVIDPNSGTLYVVAYTEEVSGGVTNYVHRLHALDVSTGNEKPNSPVEVICTNYPGTGAPSYKDNDGKGHVKWNGANVFDRPALLLNNGVIYISMGSHYDNPPFHGWVLAYNAQSLAQVGVFNTTPNGDGSAIWMSGSGPAADDQGNVYFMTGNGDFDTNYPSANSYNLGESFVKLATTEGLSPADYFTPYNQALLTANDTDLGSGGLMLLPDSVGSAAHPHLMVGGGKGGVMYLIDRDNLGHYNATNDGVVQELVSDGLYTGAGNGIFGRPAFFSGRIYYQEKGDVLRAFAITNGSLSTSPASISTVECNYGGAVMISALGASNAIAWQLQEDAVLTGGPAVLHAFDAYNLGHELYNSSMAGNRDTAGGAVKYSAPVVANGKVYVGGEYTLNVYGNGIFLAPPTISPGSGAFTNLVTVTLADTTPGVSLYYTLDGTIPTTNSAFYSGPFQLTNSADVSVIAAEPGAVNSAVINASFNDTSRGGSGTGLMGVYCSNVPPSEAFDFALTPALTRTDQTLDFDWNYGSPDPSIASTNFRVRWTGMIQPQFSETYSFYLRADGAIRLWINGQLLINGGSTNSIGFPLTLWNSSMSLEAQQFYNIEVDYFHDATEFPAELELSWGSPSTPQAIVPESQLYPVTNPPPTVVLTAPASNASFTASASVTMTANADDQYNSIGLVNFYTNGGFAGSVTNAPYTLTASGLSAGSYTLTAIASDTTGIMSTSAPVTITVTNGSGAPYGLTKIGAGPAFYNMPTTYTGGPIPPLLSQTGVFTNTPNMSPASSLVPYSPNVPLWSDGALKTRYFTIPNSGPPSSPGEQIAFAPTGAWSFPAGTIFVKTFSLLTNQTDPTSIHRLETRLLVRDINGAVYGVTYKWRPDYSDADLLTGSLSENIAITTPTNVITQTWYYPSPSDCLMCHTPVANYVLGLSARQLNANLTYPSTDVTDNQLRTINRLGLFNPAIDESAITNYERLSSLTNLTASLQERARSYLDANCAQCHQPDGTGPTFDARYETPLANQNIINTLAVKGNLGYDNVDIVTPHDVWRSALYDRMDTTNSATKMPPLARNLIDTNAVAVFAAWINSLPGTPAEAPPMISPAGGMFTGGVTVTLQPPDANAAVYYTLDGSLPTTNSFPYTVPFNLTNTATVSANAFESNFINSVAPSDLFTIQPGVSFTSSGSFSNGIFTLQLSGSPDHLFVIQSSSNLVNWNSVLTNVPSASPFSLTVPDATNFGPRFYRALQQP